MQLYGKYDKLKFVVQDREPVLRQAQTTVWPEAYPDALESGRVSFMPHDFFQPNPVKGADIYWIRYILYVQMLIPFIFVSVFLSVVMIINHCEVTTGQTAIVLRFSRLLHNP